jgi:tRNA (guanine-N7-)-methyltransferase
MARKKLERFAHNAQANNVIQEGKPLYTEIRGKWREIFFKNNHPLVLELGCGRAEYTTGLASQYPEQNFVGVDIKGSRIWKGSTVAIEQNLSNVGFLRTQISNVEFFFAPNEVNEIWITFPDPRPKGDDEHRRLTSADFFQIYRNILIKGGKIHLKTDNEPLFDFTLEVLQQFETQKLLYTKDLYNSPLNALHFGIQTTYEQKFVKQGFKIHYLQCELF